MHRLADYYTLIIAKVGVCMSDISVIVRIIRISIVTTARWKEHRIYEQNKQSCKRPKMNRVKHGAALV